MSDQADRWNESMLRIRVLLGEVLTGKGPTGQVVEIIERLGALDEMYRSAVTPEGPTPRRRSKTTGRKYRIDKVKGQEFLAEYRSVGQQPFRCPRDVYISFSRVMSRVSKPTAFDELFRRVRSDTTETLPDYLPRMCLRFWMSSVPPLVERNRKRYRSLKPSSFSAAARRAWDKLPKEEL